MNFGAIKRSFVTNLRLLEGLSLLIALIGNFLLQLNSYYGINYHSDDVGQQVLFHDWLKFGIHGTWLGADPFLFKIPFHVPVEWLFGHGRKSILFSAYLLSALFVIGAFYGLRYFAKRTQPRDYASFLLAFPWAASLFSFAAMLAFKNANLRTVELGIWLVLLALTARHLETKKRSGFWGWPTAIGIFSGFLIFNDNAMLYFCWLPLVLYMGYAYAFEKTSFQLQKFKIIALSLFTAFVSYLLFKGLFILLGLHFYQSATTLARPSELLSLAKVGLVNFLAMCNADVFSHPFTGLASWIQLLSFVVVLSGLAISIYFVIGGRGWQRFFAAQPFFLFALYIFSSSATDVSTARYLILVPFYFGFLFFCLDQKHRMGHWLAMLAFLAAIANVGSYAYWIHKARSSYDFNNYTRNEKELRVAEIIKKKGLTTGYATYGEANLTAYFSGYQATVTPIYCGFEKIRPYYLIMSEGQLYQKADKSFIIALEPAPSYFVASKYPALNLPANVDYSCSYQKIIREFGQANELIQIAPDMRLLIYNHDLPIDLSRTTKSNPIN